ncbi:hypothetical protein LBMAG40_01610 [Cyanobium sp.]|nr:hypothetical protein LBMAG40_01610 [Cyanobium sp.]
MIPGQVHTSSTALALFDQLAPVAPAELIGDWRGQGLATGHPLDGVLEAWHWHGKRFLSTEAVHPLIFAAAGGRQISVDPNWVPMALLRAPWVGRLAPLGRLAPWLVPLLATEKPRARLRQLCYRDRLSCAMVYDNLPIIDVFRRLDANSLLGVMDARGMEQPFFFTLQQPPSGGTQLAVPLLTDKRLAP